MRSHRRKLGRFLGRHLRLVARCAGTQDGAMEQLAEMFGVEPWILGSAVVSWFAAFVFWGFSSGLVFTLLAHSYPTYGSFKALADGLPTSQVKRWLRYWTTLAALVQIEYILWLPLSCLPGYHIWRLIFVIYLSMPVTTGAERVYPYFVAPLFRRNRNRIETLVNRIVSGLSNLLRGSKLGSKLKIAAEGGSDLMTSELTKAAVASIGKKAEKALVNFAEGDDAPEAEKTVQKPPKVHVESEVAPTIEPAPMTPPGADTLESRKKELRDTGDHLEQVESF
eukprot:TRINITY_DN37646_c0_g1_i2.p1 TRINITY_DN37646_c0_g1~~TRINITY_DN37646_c0_g1_i2.p1  ORF type:complete len:280 (+),score=72.77 TRINITY_DN37646_c0_g1_i2:151-990(+)